MHRNNVGNNEVLHFCRFFPPFFLACPFPRRLFETFRMLTTFPGRKFQLGKEMFRNFLPYKVLQINFHTLDFSTFQLSLSCLNLISNLISFPVSFLEVRRGIFFHTMNTEKRILTPSGFVFVKQIKQLFSGLTFF